MELLGTILVAGFATSYVVELVGAMVGAYRRVNFFKHLITLPLAFVATWYLSLSGFTLVIAGIATAFVATSLRILLDVLTSKPQVVTRRF